MTIFQNRNLGFFFLPVSKLGTLGREILISTLCLIDCLKTSGLEKNKTSYAKQNPKPETHFVFSNSASPCRIVITYILNDHYINLSRIDIQNICEGANAILRKRVFPKISSTLGNVIYSKISLQKMAFVSN